MARRINLSAAQLSAMQTATLSCIGGLIAASGFLAEFPTTAHRHVHDGAFWFWVWTTFTLMVGGYALAIIAGSDIQNGIAAQRWPDSEISRLRKLLNSPIANALTIAFLVGLVVALFGQRYRPIFWSFFALNQTLLHLRNSTREPPTKTPGPTWTNLAPLQSQHWGER